MNRRDRRSWKLEVGSWMSRIKPLHSSPQSTFPYGSHSSFQPPASSFLAFTLVELLVVIAILGILISLVTAGAQAARRRAAVTRAKVMVASLETAISSFQGDMGNYPATGNGHLVEALSVDPKNVNWNGPYMEFKHDELNPQSELLDPWGNPYVYISSNGGSPQHRPRSYDLFSLGPNGKDDGGAGDDIVNW